MLITSQLVFADPNPALHPEYNETWLDVSSYTRTASRTLWSNSDQYKIQVSEMLTDGQVVDSWSTYNVTDEQFDQIVRWKKADQIQEKATL